LEVDKTQKQALLDHLKVYNRIRNDISSDAELSGCSDYPTIHRKFYYTFRYNLPDMPSSSIQQAERSVAATNKAFHTKLRHLQDRQKWCMEHKRRFPKREQRTLDKLLERKHPVFKDTASAEVAINEYQLDRPNRTLYLSVRGRMRPQGCRNHGNQLVVRYHCNPYDRKLLESDRLFKQGKIVYRNGSFKFLVSFRMKVPDPVRDVNSQKLMGVDLGVENHAVTSTGLKISAKKHHQHIVHRKAVHASLQSKGTTSALRHLRRLKGEISRYQNDVQRGVANAVVREALRHGFTCIAMETLNHANKISAGKGRAKGIKSWAFRQQADFIAQKAMASGLTVAFVPASHTSDTCHACGYIHKNNRFTRDTFCCIKCGYTEHADINAALNIRDKFYTYPEKTRKWMLRASEESRI
jgi:IS605 OrfB family transposase